MRVNLSRLFFAVLFILSSSFVFATDEIVLYEKMFSELTQKLSEDPRYIESLFEESMIKLLKDPKKIDISMKYKNRFDLLKGKFQKIIINVENGYAEDLRIHNALFEFTNI